MHWLLGIRHLPGILGGIIGLSGTVLLSIDLLRSKKSDEAQIKFQASRTQADLKSQELVASLTSGFGYIGEFLKGYLSTLELEAQIAEEKALGVKHEIPANMRKFITERTDRSLRRLFVDTLVESQRKWPSQSTVQQMVDLVTKAQDDMEAAFKEEMARSRKFIWVAKAGIWLVGIGAIGQLVDLILSP